MPTIAARRSGNNFQFIRPAEDTLGYQPAVRFDYQPTPSLRVSFKYQGDLIGKQVIQGSIPGWNDSRMPHPRNGTDAVTVNYSLSPTMFLEATYGRAGNQLRLRQRPVFPMNDVADRGTTRPRRSCPCSSRTPSVLDQNYYAYEVLNFSSLPYWDGTRVWKAPDFSWGNRIVAVGNNQGAPPNIIYPGLLNINTTQDFSISLTKVMGRHTIKIGFYINHSLKRENNVQRRRQLRDAELRERHAAQCLRHVVRVRQCGDRQLQLVLPGVRVSAEGNFTYNNTEGYIQDNWKVNNKLTLDYGVRFVHAQPQHDCALAERQFPAGQVDAVRRAGAVCRGLRQRRVSLHGHQPPGDESADRSVPRAEQHAGHRHARAGHRQPDERPVPVGSRGSPRRPTSSRCSTSGRASAWPTT